MFLDLQGKWKAEVVGALPEDLVGEIDSAPWEKLCFDINDHAWLASETHGDTWGWAARSTEFGQPQAASRQGWDEPIMSQVGSGWVLASSCQLEINKSLRPISIPPWAGIVSVPYWDGFQASRPLPWLATKTRHALVADVRAGDASSYKEHHFKVDRSTATEEASWRDGTGALQTGAFFSHLGKASFLIDTPACCKGLVMRRTFDAFHGLQRSRLLVNGQMTGWWHQTFQDREQRWGVDDCLLRLQPGFSGGMTRVEFEPPAGAPLFSFGRLEVWALEW